MLLGKDSPPNVFQVSAIACFQANGEKSFRRWVVGRVCVKVVSEEKDSTLWIFIDRSIKKSEGAISHISGSPLVLVIHPRLKLQAELFVITRKALIQAKEAL